MHIDEAVRKAIEENGSIIRKKYTGEQYAYKADKFI